MNGAFKIVFDEVFAGFAEWLFFATAVTVLAPGTGFKRASPGLESRV
jgi:hypothetical protein